MKTNKPATLLSWLIVALSLVAAASGIFWQGESTHYEFTTLRGEAVEIWGGSGLYRQDAVAGASQEIAQDIVTLALGIPLLIVASVWAIRGSLRGRVLQAGTLGYFLYTYTAMSMLTAYNELFLVYVALMSLSLFAFILTLLSIDLQTLQAHFSEKFPRRTVAGYSLFLGLMLLLLWLKLIVPSLLAGTTPEGLYSYTTLVIQALDMGIIAPTAILTGVLLFRRSAAGYLLCSVVLVLGFTMGAALLAMIAGQMLAGVAIDIVASVIFTAISVAAMSLAIWVLAGITENTGAQRERPGQFTPPTPVLPNLTRLAALSRQGSSGSSLARGSAAGNYQGEK